MGAVLTCMGGWSKVKVATEEIQKICDQVKMQADKMAEQTFPQFVAICYRQQVVAGMNYRIKVYVGNLPGSPIYWKLSVSQALPANGGTLTVTSIEPAPLVMDL